MLCVGRSVQLKSHWITKIHHSHRGVIVVSIISAGGEKLYCLYFGSGQFMRPEAYSWIFVRVQLGRLSNRSLYQTFPVNASFLYQAVGTQANVAKTPFKLNGQIERICCRLSWFACIPTAWYKKDAFTEKVWYRLTLLSQSSCTRTNIQEYASGIMNWPKLKCNQYKLRPPLIL